MLSLPEELLLLALDDATGSDNLGVYLDRALIAAALMDLILRRRIARREPGPYDGEPKSDDRPQSFWEYQPLVHGIYPFWLHLPTYHLADTEPTGSAYLDHVLAVILAHDLGDRLHTFPTLTLVYLNRTNRMAHTHADIPPDQRLLAAHDLLAREHLLVTESRFLFVRRTNLPQGNRATGESELRERLRQGFVTRFAQADERFRSLLLLIRAAGLNAEVWGEENSDAADWRVAKSLNITMQPNPLLYDAFCYIRTGVTEETMEPLRVLAPIPR